MVTKIGLYRDPCKKKQWVIRWFGEYNPVSGKQMRYSKPFRLKTEAEEFNAAKRQQIGQCTPRDGIPDVTLTSFCKDWLNTHRTELAASATELYSLTISRLLKYFGSDSTTSCQIDRLSCSHTTCPTPIEAEPDLDPVR